MAGKKEEWRDIPGYEGRYQVSDRGRVRSLPRIVKTLTRVRKDGTRTEATRTMPGVMLRPGRANSGHVSVVIGVRNTKMVHALVLLAFVGPRPKGMDTLHLNHNPADNRLRNLRYGTRSENLKMDYERGHRAVPESFIGARWRYRDRMAANGA